MRGKHDSCMHAYAAAIRRRAAAPSPRLSPASVVREELVADVEVAHAAPQPDRLGRLVLGLDHVHGAQLLDALVEILHRDGQRVRLLAKAEAAVAQRAVEVLEEVRRVDAQRGDVPGRELGLLRVGVLDEGY